MKKNLLYLLAAVFAVVGCAKNNDIEDLDYFEKDVDGILQEVFWEQTEVPEYKVISEGTYTYAERVERAEDAFGPDEDLDEEMLAAKKEFLEQCDEMMNDEPDNAVWADYIIFEYYTIDENNNSITLSAYMDFSTAKTPDHVAFCCPYTHTLEKECATEDKGGYEAKTYLANGLFIIPDGQGFGANKDHTQSYLNHKLHARQYYDALLAALDIYFNWKKHRELTSGWTLRLFGASQGAADAIALHRFLDTTYKRIDLTPLYQKGKWDEANALCREYDYPRGSQKIDVPFCEIHRFQYSYVCCGPYCPEATMQTYHGWKEMSYPCVIPLVIKSMVANDPRLRTFTDTNGDYEKPFFSEAWDQNKVELDKIYLKKTMESTDLNYYLCKKMGQKRERRYEYPILNLDKILSDGMTKSDSEIYNALMTSLRDQDLTTGWKPKTPTKLLYCKEDKVVPYENTERLIKLFNSCNCTCKTKKFNYYYEYSSHVKCCEEYIKTKWNW